MQDRQTGTVWAHLDGYAREGPLVGERLAFVSLPQMKWGEWLELHPETLVLDPKTPFADRYRPMKIGQPHPSETPYGDDRLPANALVVGVETNAQFMGFPIDAVDRVGGVVNAVLGGEPIVVVYDSSSRTGIAFARLIRGRTVEFTADKTGPMLTLRDIDTEERWYLDGSTATGSTASLDLVFAPSFITEWYGWSAYHPDTRLYGADRP